MRARRRDRVVPGAVPLRPGAQAEDPLDPPLAARVRQGARQRPYDVLETGRRVVDGELELPDLPGVLDQAQLGERGGQFRVRPGIAARRGAEVVQVGAAQAGQPPGLRQVGAAADPELPVPAVPVELLVAVRTRGAGAQVQHGLVAVRARGLQHQDVAHLVLAREPGQPGVRAVRAEAVVAVVGADLELAGRDDQPLARKARREPGAPGRGDLVRADPRGVGEGGRRPVGGHETGQLR